jgi:hypothetical protein
MYFVKNATAGGIDARVQAEIGATGACCVYSF